MGGEDVCQYMCTEVLIRPKASDHWDAMSLMKCMYYGRQLIKSTAYCTETAMPLR